MRHSIALSTLFSAALATTDLPFFWPGGSDVNSTNAVASIIVADKGTTVVELSCPKSVDLNDCGWGTGELTMSIISASTYQAALSQVNFKCTSSQSANVQCAMGYVMDDESDGQTNTVFATTTLSGSSAALQTATVTAGEDKLKAAGTAAASGTAATSASAGAKASSSAASATGSAASASASASASAQPSSAATRFGVEGAVLAAMVGGAALVL
ncbi:hypothetical protein P280DRAFT_465972 [Massarina eburnea CBS 473.64]|uniref:GPI anchored protein n=1 Tax=Massarina eburnea CBS 473.64 TaxID=1395130 RepID=A0A6A6SBR2_9PLEO|nr:hypothetical protein P280DRAFT_465972 [Massarina eburnea CBS 473.64]